MTIRLTEPLLRELVAETVVRALESGARLPDVFELRLPGRIHREFLIKLAAGHLVLLRVGEAPPTVH